MIEIISHLNTQFVSSLPEATQINLGWLFHQLNSSDLFLTDNAAYPVGGPFNPPPIPNGYRLIEVYVSDFDHNPILIPAKPSYCRVEILSGKFVYFSMREEEISGTGSVGRPNKAHIVAVEMN